MLLLLPSFLMPVVAGALDAGEYAAAPVAESYAERRAQYLAYQVESGGNGAFSALARIESGLAPDESLIHGALDHMDRHLVGAGGAGQRQQHQQGQSKTSGPGAAG